MTDAIKRVLEAEAKAQACVEAAQRNAEQRLREARMGAHALRSRCEQRTQRVLERYRHAREADLQQERDRLVAEAHRAEQRFVRETRLDELARAIFAGVWPDIDDQGS